MFQRILLIILILISGHDLNAQTGSIQLSEFQDCEIPHIKLTKNDTIAFNDFYDPNTGIVNLSPGKYRVEISCEGEPFVTYYQMDVFENETTWINYDSGFYAEDNYDEDKNILYPIVTQNVGLLYGPRVGSPLPFQSDNVEFKQSISVQFKATRFFNIGTRIGTDFRWTIFDRDTLFTSVPDMKNERYFNWNLSGGVFFRFGNVRKLNSPHFVLDIGADYYLPLYFRHIYNVGNSKIAQRKIHHFNDVRVFTRIGNSYLQFLVEYRLFDYVRGGYPQTPKWIFGINFDLPTD